MLRILARIRRHIYRVRCETCGLEYQTQGAPKDLNERRGCASCVRKAFFPPWLPKVLQPIGIDTGEKCLNEKGK